MHCATSVLFLQALHMRGVSVQSYAFLSVGAQVGAGPVQSGRWQVTSKAETYC